jgi:MarR family transcriptional regulator, negative regulator of the multidrug operon emrRAB
MSAPPDRLVNLLGALAIGLADRVRWAALDEVGLGGETAAALVAIGHAPGLSIDHLGHVLRLSHPGAVRLVDRLTQAGLAVRGSAARDRRSVALHLTASGRSRRDALLKRRHDVLASALEAVLPEDRAVLERVSDAILRGLPDDARSAMTVCRYCDDQRCPECPMDGFGALSG